LEGQDNSSRILLSIARDETVAAERRGSPLWLPCALQLSRGKEALDRIAMLEPVLEIGVGDYSPFSHVG
jgi:hypothetical protein